MSHPSQCERILAALRDRGLLTSLDAFRMHPPICALHSRIAELRKRGYQIRCTRFRRFWTPPKRPTPIYLYSLEVCMRCGRMLDTGEEHEASGLCGTCAGKSVNGGSA